MGSDTRSTPMDVWLLEVHRQPSMSRITARGGFCGVGRPPRPVGTKDARRSGIWHSTPQQQAGVPCRSGSSWATDYYSHRLIALAVEQSERDCHNNGIRVLS